MSDHHRSLDRALERVAGVETPRWGVSSEDAHDTSSSVRVCTPAEQTTPPSEDTTRGYGSRADVRKSLTPLVVTLTPEEYEQLAEAAYRGGRGAWVSKTELEAIESIIRARLIAAGGAE